MISATTCPAVEYGAVVINPHLTCQLTIDDGASNRIDLFGLGLFGWCYHFVEVRTIEEE